MKINKDAFYQLYKLSSKNKSPYNYPDSNWLVFDGGLVSIIKHNCLYISSPTHWYRTSPIINFTEIENGYIIETKNSQYKLIKK